MAEKNISAKLSIDGMDKALSDSEKLDLIIEKLTKDPKLLRLRVDTRGLDNVLKFTKGLENSLRPLYNTARNVGLALGGIGTMFLGKGFETYKQIELTTIAFKGLTGSLDEAKLAMQGIKEGAIGTPIDFANLAKYTQRMTVFTKDWRKSLAMVKDFGVVLMESGQNINVLDRFITNLGDIATGKGTQRDFNELVKQMPLMSMKLRELGIENMKGLKAYAEGLGKTEFEFLQTIARGIAENSSILEDYKKTFTGITSMMRGRIQTNIAEWLEDSGITRRLVEQLNVIYEDLPNILARFKDRVEPFVKFLLKTDLKRVLDQILDFADAFFTIIGNGIGFFYVNVLKPFLSLLGRGTEGKKLGEFAGSLVLFYNALKLFNRGLGFGKLIPLFAKIFSMFGKGGKSDTGNILFLYNIGKFKADILKITRNIIALVGALAVLMVAAEALKQFDEKMPEINIGLLKKTAALVTVVTMMMGLTEAVGFIAKKLPTQTVIGMLTMTAIIGELYALAMVMKEFDKNVPEFSLGFTKKVAAMETVIVSFAITIGALGALIAGTGGIGALITVAGFAAIAGIILTINEFSKSLHNLGNGIDNIVSSVKSIENIKSIDISNARKTIGLIRNIIEDLGTMKLTTVNRSENIDNITKLLNSIEMLGNQLLFIARIPSNEFKKAITNYKKIAESAKEVIESDLYKNTVPTTINEIAIRQVNEFLKLLTMNENGLANQLLFLARIPSAEFSNIKTNITNITNAIKEIIDSELYTNDVPTTRNEIMLRNINEFLKSLNVNENGLGNQLLFLARTPLDEVKKAVENYTTLTDAIMKITSSDFFNSSINIDIFNINNKIKIIQLMNNVLKELSGVINEFKVISREDISELSNLLPNADGTDTGILSKISGFIHNTNEIFSSINMVELNRIRKQQIINMIEFLQQFPPLIEEMKNVSRLNVKELDNLFIRSYKDSMTSVSTFQKISTIIKEINKLFLADDVFKRADTALMKVKIKNLIEIFQDLTTMAETINQFDAIILNVASITYHIDLIKQWISSLNELDGDNTKVKLNELTEAMNNILEIFKGMDVDFNAFGFAYGDNLMKGWNTADAEKKITVKIRAELFDVLRSMESDMYNIGFDLGSAFRNGFDTAIEGMSASAINEITAIQLALNSLTTPNLNVNVGASGSIPGFATGGIIGNIFKPRGTDTVPAMLTPGEFVLNRNATRYWGSDIIENMNNMNYGKVYEGFQNMFRRNEHNVVNNVYNNTKNNDVVIHQHFNGNTNDFSNNKIERTMLGVL